MTSTHGMSQSTANDCPEGNPFPLSVVAMTAKQFTHNKLATRNAFRLKSGLPITGWYGKIINPSFP